MARELEYVQFISARASLTKNTGVTLIELLFTMFLALLLIAIGTPGFVTLRQGQTQSAAINQTYALLQFARSLAITDATPVTYCASTNYESCTGGQNFAEGAVILSQNNDGSQSLVRVIDPVKSPDFYIQLVDFPSDTAIEFTDTGEISNLTTAASITLCDPRGTQEGAALVVNPLGMVRQATDDDGNDIINLHDQSNITCG